MAKNKHWFTEFEREQARWTDLKLRSYFPCARTEIWQGSMGGYEIFAPAEDIDVKQHGSWFKESVRPVAWRVALTNHRPANAKWVPIIPDKDMGNSLSGMPLSHGDLEIILAGKFPSLTPLHPPEKSANEPGVLNYVCEGQLDPVLGDKVCEAARSLFPGFEVSIEGGAKHTPTPEVQDGLKVRPISHRSGLPEFVRFEEEKWFQDTAAMLAGELTPQDSLIRRREDSTACFIPSSVGRTFDLRQALMAFDILYLELPVTDTPEPRTVEGTFGVSRQELLSLVEGGRARIVTRQPEERIDLKLLQELHEVNPSAVAGRRATSEVVLTDLVITAQNSLFSHPEVRPILPELVEALAQKFSLDKSEEMRRLLLPETMLRRTFQSFMTHGISMIGSSGIGEVVASDLKRIQGKDFRIEAYHCAEDIQLAHALGATLLPQPKNELVNSWLPIMRGMGETLNLHANCTPSKFNAWQNSLSDKACGKVVLPPVPIFVFEDPARNDTSLQDVLDLTARRSDRTKAHGLISRLAELPAEERIAEAERLAFEMGKFFKQQGRISCLDFSGEAVGAIVPGGGLAMKLFPTVFERAASRMPIVDRFASAIASVTDRKENEDIEFLSKVYRVARLHVGKDE